MVDSTKGYQIQATTISSLSSNMTRTSDYTERNSEAKKRVNEPDCSKKWQIIHNL